MESKQQTPFATTLDADLLRRVKVAAERQGMKIRVFVANALRAALKEGK